MLVESKRQPISSPPAFGKEVSCNSCHIHTLRESLSVAGIVVDKRRAALTPAMIDALVFPSFFFFGVDYRMSFESNA